MTDKRKARGKYLEERERMRTLFVGGLSWIIAVVIDIVTAVIAWVYCGQPHYYFREWDGVWIHTIFWSVKGLLFGLIFGASVWAVEKITRKQIQIPCFLTWVAVSAVCIFGIRNATVMKFQIVPVPPSFPIDTLFFIVCVTGSLVSLKKRCLPKDC